MFSHNKVNLFILLFDLVSDLKKTYREITFRKGCNSIALKYHQHDLTLLLARTRLYIANSFRILQPFWMQKMLLHRKNWFEVLITLAMTRPSI
jgi:hypothetical protein